MSPPKAAQNEPSAMSVARRIIRILESAGENVDAEKELFFESFGVPFDRRTKVSVKKVSAPKRKA